MPDTINVSPAYPDKIVVNGCDLLNREQLSHSQNRELQRYIDENAHLLGFLDKSKDEKEEKLPHKSYNSFSLGRNFNSALDNNDNNYHGNNGGTNFGANKLGADGTQSLNYRVNSPASSDYGRVSWSDKVDPYRARSHSPKRETGNLPPTNHSNNNNLYNNSPKNNYIPPSNNTSNYGTLNDSASLASSRPYSPAYSTSDKRRTPYYDYEPSSNLRTESPWGGTWSQGSRDNVYDDRDSQGGGWKGFPKNDVSTYSTLERHPDDYNRFETHKYREQQIRRSVERDETKKFYGYGDHKIITDPNFIKKTIKPRRLFYSPIGDGVVEADGIELKRGPPDLTPRVSVIHERYLEKGDPGRAGKRVYEHVWDQGLILFCIYISFLGNKGRNNDGKKIFNDLGGPNGLGNGNDGLNGPRNDNGNPFGNGRDSGDPFNRGNDPFGDDGNRNKYPNTNNGDGGNKNQFPLSTGRFPNANDYPDNNEPRSGRTSALSVGTDGQPREGWTKTFIVNPRELIHQYANETNTNIFDINDHTPKKLTSYKKTITPVEQKDFAIIE